MGSKTQRRKRYQRRRAHAVLTKGRPGLVATAKALDIKMEPYQEKILTEIDKHAVQAQRHAFSSIPTRAKCPECGFSQKVKRDGTMGRHDIYIGSAAQQCSGTGKKWNST